MRKLGILLGGALALAACETAPHVPTAAELANPLIAPGYLAQAASSDLFEVQSGQLAQQMSQNPNVRQFAATIMRDHTNSTQMLMSTAMAAHVPTPPVLLPPQQAMLDQLRSAGSGYAFDQAFQQIQIQAHQQALMLHQGYAQSGDNPALRNIAAQIVPVVQQHLAMAQSLQLVAPPPPAPPPPPPQPMTAPRPGERGERGERG